jgi:hypothetical protein
VFLPCAWTQLLSVGQSQWRRMQINVKSLHRCYEAPKHCTHSWKACRPLGGVMPLEQRQGMADEKAGNTILVLCTCLFLSFCVGSQFWKFQCIINWAHCFRHPTKQYIMMEAHEKAKVLRWEREREDERENEKMREHVSNELKPSTRPHLLRFLPPPNKAKLGTKSFTHRPSESISRSILLHIILEQQAEQDEL